MTHQNLIEVNPNKMSGTPVFRDTRVPIKNLFDCIEEGETVTWPATRCTPSRRQDSEDWKMAIS